MVSSAAGALLLMNLIKKLVRLIAGAAVSRAGLTILNLSIAVIITRFLFNLAHGFMQSGMIEKHVFELFGQGVAIRLVAVGVLLMDRHEILVFAGKRTEHDAPDAFTEATRPYGAVYLCFGLIMEVLLEQTRIPLLPSAGGSVGAGIAALTIFLTLISLLTCLSLLHDVWKTRANAARRPSPAE